MDFDKNKNRFENVKCNQKNFYLMTKNNKVRALEQQQIIEFDNEGYAFCISGCVAHNIGFAKCDNDCECHCHKGISRIRYCLADDIAYCMECNKPFHTHTEKQQEKCRQHAKDRKAVQSNMMYLNHGFKWKMVLVACDVKDCNNLLQVSYDRTKIQGDYGYWVCRDHQDIDDLEYKNEE